MVVESEPHYDEDPVSNGLLHYLTYPIYVISSKLGFSEKILPKRQIYLSKTQDLRNANMKYQVYLRGVELAEKRKFHDRAQALSRTVNMAVNQRAQLLQIKNELEVYCNEHGFEMTDFDLPQEMLDLEERTGKLYRALKRPGVRR